MSIFEFLTFFIQILISITVRSQNVWPNRVIPYTVDGSIGKDPRQFYSFLTAKSILQNQSCLSFVPRRKERNYVRFSDLGPKTTCWDIFGKTNGVVPVNVGPRCLKPFSDSAFLKNQIFSDCDLSFLNNLYGCRNSIKKTTKEEYCSPSQWPQFRKLKNSNFPKPNRNSWTRAPGSIRRPLRTTTPSPNRPVEEPRTSAGNCSSACRYNGILTPLYQAFNDDPMVRNHFYTENKLEQGQMLVKNYMKESNLGFIGRSGVDRSCTCLKPLYRLHSDLFQDTMLTTEEAEKDRATTLLGYRLDRVIGYCTSEPGCGAYLPLYRLFNFIVKDHLYTTDQKEMHYHKTHPLTGYGMERIECFIWQFNISTKGCEE